MTQSQQIVPSRHCPRCGGLMTKLPGSNMYWHADNNHRSCEITNIVETSFAGETDASAAQTGAAKKSSTQK